jgi:phosphinothricin acetyltransferase
MCTMEIRDASATDLPAILAIYNEIIASSTAIYTEHALSLDDRRTWLEGRQNRGFPVLAGFDGEELLGFASFGDWRPWPDGYRYTVEHSVYVRADVRGAGIGMALMTALTSRASAMGKHVMIGAIDADNAASLRFHAKLGFEEVAYFRQVARKFDRWLDLVFMQRFLGKRGAEHSTGSDDLSTLQRPD